MGSVTIRDMSNVESLVPFGKIEIGGFFYSGTGLYMRVSEKGARSIAERRLISVGENVKVVEVDVHISFSFVTKPGSEEYGGA